MPHPRAALVMIVDDEQDIVDVITELLREEAYPTVSFTDSRQAWEALVRSPGDYGLVFLDLRMPGLSGFEFLALMQRHQVAVPVVLQTATIRCEDVINKYHVRCVKKPFDVDKLMLVLKECYQSQDCCLPLEEPVASL